MNANLALFAVLFSTLLFAEENFPPLDPVYRDIRPIVETNNFKLFDVIPDFPRINDLPIAIGRQTPVKSQGRRGTCSIFSNTAIIESLIKIRDHQEIDLAENYMEFLAMRSKGVPQEGSDTPINIPVVQSYGDVLESEWPYEENDWTTPLSSAEEAKKEQTCGTLSGTAKEICHLSHLNPYQDPYQQNALNLRNEKRLYSLRYQRLSSDQQIKQLLSANYPVVLALEFFYGAWNHGKKEGYGIGQIDWEKWSQGMVGVPDANDIAISKQHPAGHSIVVVGYDDMKRVFYFKNSWGKGSFGRTSDLIGENTTPGYGSIPYDYAYRYGIFYYVGIQ